MTKEQWREIPGFKGRYEVSDQGRVRDGNNRRILKPYFNGLGYAQYSLYADGKKVTRKVHRLAMLAFVGPSELVVNHKNGNTGDNRLENLEYVTPSENVRHSYDELGRQSLKGEANPFSKLTHDKVVEIRRLASQGIAKRVLAEKFGVSRRQISNIVRGKQWQFCAEAEFKTDGYAESMGW